MEAERVVILFWIMLAGAAVIWSVVTGLGFYVAKTSPHARSQPEWYLSEHLGLWRDGRRGGTDYAHIMSEIAHHMTPEQIEAVPPCYAERPEQDR